LPGYGPIKNGTGVHSGLGHTKLTTIAIAIRSAKQIRPKSIPERNRGAGLSDRIRRGSPDMTSSLEMTLTHRSAGAELGA
jgi:hypothetical protein